MKFSFLFIPLFAVFAGCNNSTDKGFTVNGKINGATADLIFLEEASLGSMEPVIVDSARLQKDGSFTLTALSKEENLYVLRLTQQINPVATIINDSKEITVEADIANAQQPYTVKGSPASEALVSYLSKSNQQLSSLYTMSRELDSLRRPTAMDSTVLSLQMKRDAAATQFTNYVTNFISESKSPSLSIFALGSYQSYASNPGLGLIPFSQQQMMDVINTASLKFPKHQSLASLKQTLQSPQQPQQTAAAGLLNAPAPDFTLPDVSGKPVALSSFKGKYVLVDFWASWCGPCRKENPNVVQAYNQFKDKNFTILGVSLDKEKAPWEKAIAADGLSWTHVSDLKFWDSGVVPLYNIQGIPYNVLLDPNGVVIAENLRGEELSKKLVEVLK